MSRRWLADSRIASSALLALLAASTARAQQTTATVLPTAPVTPSVRLAGTSWRLVEFQSMDDTIRRPDDRAKYTLEFGKGGKLTARIDCNRGLSSWKLGGPNQIEFGPLALTRAQCPPGSLHDQIVRQWPFIRSYVIKKGHLFLALAMDGGIYEFEPITRQQVVTPKS